MTSPYTPPAGLGPAALATLREAAALVHAAPALRVRLRDGDRLLATVAAPSPLDLAPERWLSPCAFRVAVADAWALASSGRPVGLSGCLGSEPAVDVGVPAGGATHPLGVHRWQEADGSSWRWAVATTGRPATCRAVCEAIDDDPRTALVRDVRLRADPLLGCCVLLATSDPAPADAEAVAGLLGDVVVRQAVDQLLDDVAA